MGIYLLLNVISLIIQETKRVFGSLPKCQPFKWLDFYFLFALVSVNFCGVCWFGEGDLGLCSSWLLIFDFVSASCLPCGFWKRNKGEYSIAVF